MTYEFNKYQVLLKLFEAEDVEPMAEVTKDYVIPFGEHWFVLNCGGGTSGTRAEIEFLFSMDGGETWINPMDPTNDVIMCLFSSGATVQVGTPVAVDAVGDGENIIIRIQCKNLGEATAPEIVGFFNGWIE